MQHHASPPPRNHLLSGPRDWWAHLALTAPCNRYLPWPVPEAFKAGLPRTVTILAGRRFSDWLRAPGRSQLFVGGAQGWAPMAAEHTEWVPSAARHFLMAADAGAPERDGGDSEGTSAPLSAGRSAVFRNPVAMWNAKYTAWLRLQRHLPQVEVVRYEDLLADPRALIEGLARRFCLPWRRGGTDRAPGGHWDSVARSLFSNRTISRTSAQRAKWERKRGFYLQERWRPRLRAADCAFISSQLDPAVLEQLGYRRRRCDDVPVE